MGCSSTRTLWRQQADTIFREEALLVSLKDPQIYSVHVSEGMKDSNMNQNSVWTVPQTFNPLRYVNEPRYLERDPGLRLAGGLGKELSTCNLYSMISLKTSWT